MWALISERGGCCNCGDGEVGEVDGGKVGMGEVGEVDSGKVRMEEVER